MAAFDNGLYIYLPSSVKSGKGSNKYTTTFSSPIQLPSGFEYEAAVVKMIYPTTAENIYEGTFSYYDFKLKQIWYSWFPSGRYILPDDFIKVFEKQLEDNKDFYKISADKVSRRFILECASRGEEKPFISFSENIQILTGLPAEISKEGHTVGKPWDSSGGLSTLYCYCDIMKNVNIGDAVAPIILVTKYEQIKENSAIEYEPLNPVYVPLSKKQLNSVTIEIRSRTGMLFPFTAGESMVLLHIRIANI